jgi:hypothetical protein
MAFNANLDFGDLKDLRIVSFSYNVNRDIDVTGRPSGGNRGGTIDFTIETTADTKTKLFEWMVSEKTNDGVIKIEDDLNPGSNVKEINFEMAYIIGYGESFHWQGSENIMQSFTISAKKLKQGSGELDNKWK